MLHQPDSDSQHGTDLGSKHPFWKQRLSDRSLFYGQRDPLLNIGFHKGREATFEASVLDPQEEAAVYGLEERFDAVARRGRSVDFVPSLTMMQLAPGLGVFLVYLDILLGKIVEAGHTTYLGLSSWMSVLS